MMNWIPTKTKLPDTTRAVFASNGKQIAIFHYSEYPVSDWFNQVPILPGYENWINTDETAIVCWCEIDDLHKTLPEVK